MNELLAYIVALVIAVFWTYRQICQLRYSIRRRRVRDARFRGVVLRWPRSSCGSIPAQPTHEVGWAAEERRSLLTRTSPRS